MTTQKETQKEIYSGVHGKAKSNLGNRGAGIGPSVQITVTAVLTTLVLGLVLFAASCAPASVVGGGTNDPTAPGAVTGLAVDMDSKTSTSFVVRWTAPTDMGTKAGGAALGSDEIGYRVYYLAGSADDTVLAPDAALVIENGVQVQVQVQVEMRELQATIMELSPETRYFVTVVSYNSTATQRETASEVIEVSTIAAEVTDESTAPGAVTGLAVAMDSKTSSSFTIQWTAPTDMGTKADGTALGFDEIGYRVYYLAGSADDTVLAPDAASVIENGSLAQVQVEVQVEMEELRATIMELSPETRYFVTVVSYNSTATQLETASEVIEASTNPLVDFEGRLGYGTGTETQTNHEFVEGTVDTIETTSVPNIPSGASGTIVYNLTRNSDTVVFNSEPMIDEYGKITIDTTSTGTADYTVRASANGYRAQEVTLTIIIVNARTIQVSTYYSDVGTTIDELPVALGQAVADDSSTFPVPDVVVLTISNLLDENYTIHSGLTENNYSGSYTEPASDGVITISKSKLKSELVANSISFTDGVVIGISGQDIESILHVATYRPSNIYNHQDLQAMRVSLNRDYVLQNDIDFIPMTSAGTAVSNYEAVGTSDTPFKGSLKGANEPDSAYTITGIEIVSSDDYQGLFGVMRADAVDTVIAQNLVLKGFKIAGRSVVGSLAGQVNGGTIENVRIEVSDADVGKVEVSGYVDATGNSVGDGGGLLGRTGTDVTEIQIKIRNTNSAVAVTGLGMHSNNIGGLVGRIFRNVLVEDSYATGLVSGNDNVGGLVGYNISNVTGYATGSVTGRGDNVGGLVGQNTSGGNVSGHMTGSVEGNNNVGGLVGQNGDGGTMSTVSGYMTGSVTGSGDNVGGLVGQNTFAGTVSGYMTAGDMTADGDVTGSNGVGGLVGQNIGTVSGYTARSVSVAGNNNVGGLVGHNGKEEDGIMSTVLGYMAGSVEGNQYVGGLVGQNIVNSIVSGYTTGDVTANQFLGGLVGFNSGTATGYVTGTVSGKNVAGGLVGWNNSILTGYTRAIVRRVSGTDTSFTSFGKTIGYENGTSTTFSSAYDLDDSSRDESQIYDGDTGTTALIGATGTSGTSVIITSATGEAEFPGFSFGTALHKWVSLSNVTWPVINIGDDIKSANDQLTPP